MERPSNMVQVGWGYYDGRGFLVLQERKPKKWPGFPVYARRP